MATINETGAIELQVLFSNNDAEMMADMMLTEPVDADAMTLYVSKMRRVAGEKYQFGLLTLR